METYIKIFKGFRNILSGAVYLAGVAALLLIAPKLLNIEPAIVLSGSMSPALKTGDIVYIKKPRDNVYQVGDIVSFKYKGAQKSSTHRIVDIDINGNIYTKGDSNESIDMVTIICEQIEGKVIITIPKIGYTVSMLQEKKWKILLICIISVNFLLEFIDVEYKEDAKDET